MQVQHAPGTLTNLLRVAVEGSLPVEVRQQAAIQIKNVSKRAWEATGGQPNALVALLCQTLLHECLL